MTTVADFYRTLDEVAPFSSALDYDNAGLLVGSPQKPVTKVLLSLDITPGVVAEAAAGGCELIVSHHPVIFTPLRSITDTDVPYLLAQSGIAAICAHTNLDMAPEVGVNAVLAGLLGIRNSRAMTRHGEFAETLLGEVDACSPRGFAETVRQRLRCPAVQLAPGKTRVRTVALCSGAGGEFIADAIAAGADAFVTGEVKHHEWLAAGQAGLTVVCAGHFYTEDPAMERLMRLLQDRYPHIAFSKSAASENPFVFVG